MCYGLMGAVMKTRDLPHFTSYLNEHYGRRPPDHLIVEWYAGEKPQSAEYVGSRVHLTFKFNMFEHLGDSSTLRSGKMPKFAGCYNYLEAPVLFEVRALVFALSS